MPEDHADVLRESVKLALEELKEIELAELADAERSSPRYLPRISSGTAGHQFPK
jgi:hypothetical protein